MRKCNEVFIVYQDEYVRLRVYCDRVGKHRRHTAPFGGCNITWPHEVSDTGGDRALWEIQKAEF